MASQDMSELRFLMFKGLGQGRRALVDVVGG